MSQMVGSMPEKIIMKSEEKKMKKVLSVLCAILLVSAMTVAAFAEAVPSPSVDVPEVVEIVVTDKDGNVVELTIDETTFSLVLLSEKDISEEDKAILDEAAAVFETVESIEELLPECAGMEVVDIMNLLVSDDIAAFLEAGGTVAVKLDLKMELPEGAKMQIIRFIEGEWVLSENETVEIQEDGTVVLHLNQPGVFALLIG